MKFASVAAAAAAYLAAGASAFGLKPSPSPTKPKTFQWRYPFEPEALAPFNPTCESIQAFPATQYTLHDLMEAPPKGLGPWAPGLKKFFQGREYPGGWGGWDRHLHDRSILKMEYSALPVRVREWIEEQERSDGGGKGLFGIFKKPEAEDDTIEDTVPPPEAGEVDRKGDKGKVAMFAPGALYEILPLFVADGSNCQDVLSDLSKYKAEPTDAGVVAWPSHTEPTAAADKRSISIRVKALLLARRDDVPPRDADGKGSEKELWEESEGKPKDAAGKPKESSTEQAKEAKPKDEL